MKPIKNRLLLEKVAPGGSSLVLPDSATCYNIQGMNITLQRGYVLCLVNEIGPEVKEVKPGDLVIVEKIELVEVNDKLYVAGENTVAGIFRE